MCCDLVYMKRWLNFLPLPLALALPGTSAAAARFAAALMFNRPV